MRTFSVSTKISQKHKEALGDICVHFSLLENTIARVIWALRGQTMKIGRPHTANLMMRELLCHMRKEALAKFGPAHPSYRFYNKNVAANIEDNIVPTRNHYVHGLWGHGTARGEKRLTYVLSYFRKTPGVARVATLEALRVHKTHMLTMIAMIERTAPKFLGSPLP